MLDIVLSYNPVQYQGKLMMQTWENDKKLNFGSQIFFFCFFVSLDRVPSYHPMQFKEKLINQTWENGKKPSFGLDFGPKKSFVDLTSTRW